MDLIRQIDELYRTRDEHPQLETATRDAWAAEIAHYGLLEVSGIIAVDGSNLAKLRRVQEVRENMVEDTYLGPSLMGVGTITLSVYK